MNLTNGPLSRKNIVDFECIHSSPDFLFVHGEMNLPGGLLFKHLMCFGAFKGKHCNPSKPTKWHDDAIKLAMTI